ncbi:MAG: glycerophosphodiester phosphodiesterase [Promethearchaeia archaeon]
MKNAHQLGFKIHVWTINNEKDMIRLIKLGVDGIFTDNAPLLKSILKKYKK